MIRFCYSKIYCIEYEKLNQHELCAYFTDGHYEETVYILKRGGYIGRITYDSLEKSKDLDESIQTEYLILDETIWQKGREYFIKHREADLIPVLDKEHHLICFAWQDEEANRELRMLRELEACKDATDFHDLKPDCAGVVIHGCNELAWYFAQYLIRKGITVNVDGEFWQELGTWKKQEIPAFRTYEIWAEGVHQKTGNWKQERLRSSSVEFECVDEIYEANIKAGKITDADGDVEDLLERLRKEKKIIIRGTGTKAQDAYDWLFSNGIDICAFQSGKADETRRGLLGKPILRPMEVEEKFKDAIIIESGAKHSTWGLNDIDNYDYIGYERNKRYFFLKDYIDVPENNLIHIFTGRNLILVGDIHLCNRVYRWCKQKGIKLGEIGYWDILGENKVEIEKCEMMMLNRNVSIKEDVYLLILPRYSYKGHVAKIAAGKEKVYCEQFNVYGIYDYTDYFSDMIKSIHLENVISKYNSKELRPLGILLGAIPPYSGNSLVRQSLEGHTHIIMIEEYGFLNDDLYLTCVRLAEEKAEDILSDFWMLFQEEVGEEEIILYFPNKERFHYKMETLLNLKDRFTSQELFVMIHLAYEAMYGREILDLKNTIIYWEPHQWSPELVREWAYWLESREIKGFTLNMVRNKYICAGSAMRTFTKLNWREMNTCMYGWNVKQPKLYECWDERIIKFEEFKCNPKEILMSLCEWLGILYSDILMKTTSHGKEAFYGNITGFDVKPVYNLYEEYFTVFDRMRICLAASLYQKEYGYPYISSLNFSRRELQEMFLKDFHWERLLGVTEGKDEKNICRQQKIIRQLLWLVRMAEIMEVEIDETYGVLQS